MPSVFCVIKKKDSEKRLGLKKRASLSVMKLQFCDDSACNVALLKTEIKPCFQDVKEASGTAFCRTAPTD